MPVWRRTAAPLALHDSTPPPPRGRRRHWKLVAALCAVVLLAGVAWAGWLMHQLDTFNVSGKGWKFASQVYADWTTLTPGAVLSRQRVLDDLEALEYKESKGVPRQPGEMREVANGVELVTRGFHFPDAERKPQGVRVTFSGGTVLKVEALADGAPLSGVRLEPVKLADLQDADKQERTYVTLKDLPVDLRHAVVVSEDKRFYSHAGIDLRGVMRAMARNVKAGGLREGGSTLTQQTVKNVFLSQQRTVWRKASEAFLAVLMDARYSKDQILEFYLNQIYLGQWGASSIGGVESAARFYFGKHAHELTLPEAATLAGMIPAPNAFSPHRNAKECLRRRNVVLKDMLTEKYIDQARYAAAVATPLTVIDEPPLPATAAPYFVEYVSQLLAKQFPGKALTSKGLRIFTTLDRQMETLAESTLAQGVRESQQRIAWRADTVVAEGALISLEPSTGAIRTLVGGSDYRHSQFNRAVDAVRQPGSSFKPVVYAAAIDAVNRPGHTAVFTPGTVLDDTPTEFPSKEGPWKPRNYEGDYYGKTTLRHALYKSLNVATVNLSMQVGLQTIIDYAHKLGLASPLQAVPSLALGVCEVTPIELTSVYATFANGGVRHEPFAVRAVLDMKDKVVYQHEARPVTVLSPAVAYVMTSLLEDVIVRGTGNPARSMFGFTAPAAGKTGTTNDEVDAWFVGYTPSLVTGVWVGADRGGELGLTGAQAALPVWARFMWNVTKGRPVEDFVAPAGVTTVSIDGDTGLLARADCYNVVRVPFLAGTEPTTYCDRNHEHDYFSESFADTTAVFEDSTLYQDEPPASDEGAGNIHGPAHDGR